MGVPIFGGSSIMDAASSAVLTTVESSLKIHIKMSYECQQSHMRSWLTKRVRKLESIFANWHQTATSSSHPPQPSSHPLALAVLIGRTWFLIVSGANRPRQSDCAPWGVPIWYIYRDRGVPFCFRPTPGWDESANHRLKDIETRRSNTGLLII